MQITYFELVVVQLLKNAIITPIDIIQNSSWDCEPVYTTGLNDKGEVILNIEITLRRKKWDKQLTIVTMTSFRLTLSNKDVVPTTQQDFEFYALVTQAALDHTRMFYLQEAKENPFKGDLLPVENRDKTMNKLKLALGLNSN